MTRAISVPSISTDMYVASYSPPPERLAVSEMFVVSVVTIQLRLD